MVGEVAKGFVFEPGGIGGIFKAHRLRVPAFQREYSVDCVQQMDSPWFFGRYGFVLRDAFSLPLIPCRGKLSFFALEPETNALTAAALRALAGEQP